MRKLALIALSCVSLAAAAPEPQKIVFARVWPNAGQVGLFIADADGGGERLLVGAGEIDYDPVWSPDAASIVFTSDRNGSADLYRVKPDGTGLERLTENPAYDDQAAFAPDGKQLVFVTTRNGGTSDLWTMDLQTKKARALTSGPGGDFRPAWSPDGKWIAFSSDRGSTMPMGHGRWEHLQVADVYVIHPDGTGLKRMTEHGNFCGSPKFSADNKRLLAYCMDAEDTLETRRPSPKPESEYAQRRPLETRLVSIDIATAATTDVPAGPGVKFNPSFVSADEVGYVRKDVEAGIYYTSGKKGPKGDVRSAAWSPDGKRVAFHRRQTAPPTNWLKTFSRNPNYELTLTGILPSYNAAGDKFVMTGRPAPGTALGASLQVVTTGSNTAEVIYQDKTRNVMAPSFSPAGDKILFGLGVYNLFFNGFNGLVLKTEDRTEGGAQIAMVNADGSGFHEVTSGANNNGFPSMAPDGKRFVYRSFGPDGEGLRIMNLETKAVTKLTEGYDNFPLWSPRGDLIMFSRAAKGDYEIYTIKPDGTGVKRLTFSKGNDAHMAWSPDGESIVWASSRLGFKDEGIYTDAPQPYGELFVMRYDGTNVQQLTDNQWEDGTPAWQPARRLPNSRSSGLLR
jgi:Tol biopolymer transport system component